MKRKILIHDLGKAEYRPVWDLQKEAQRLLIDRKLNKKGEASSQPDLPDMMLYVEHPHVYTLGKSGNQNNLLQEVTELANIHAEFIHIDRGGDITYHGPGQLVAYPIIDLENHFTDMHKYLRFLEEAVIRTCADFNIGAGRIKGLTGVWAGDEKICAMGIRCSRWVTMHGLALNVSTDLNYFDYIVPCGITGKKVTSMEKILGRAPDINRVKESLTRHLCDIFNITPVQDSIGNEPILHIPYLLKNNQKAQI